MMKPYLSFGGVCVLLVDNPSHIPPLIGCSLLQPKHLSDADAQDKSLWGLFDLILILY